MKNPGVLIASFVVPLVTVGIVLGLYPRLVTGDYCRITVTALPTKRRGEQMLRYDATISAGARLVTRDFEDGKQVSFGSVRGGDFVFPAWPSHGSSGSSFAITRLEETVFNVELGKTYIIQPGRPLILYRIKYPGGHSFESRLELYPPGQNVPYTPLDK